MPTGRSGQAAMANARVAYMLELARGCSYIRSTLTAESEERAVAEVLAEFHELYGGDATEVFQQLLAEDLTRRGRRTAASAVCSFGKKRR